MFAVLNTHGATFGFVCGKKCLRRVVCANYCFLGDETIDVYDKVGAGLPFLSWNKAIMTLLKWHQATEELQ